MKILLVAFCLLTSCFTYSAESFRVSTQVFHKNKLVAQPVMVVEEGVVAEVKYSMSGEASYEYSVIIKSNQKDKANISLKFVSGELTFSPDLKVDVGDETTAIINDFKLKLLVEKIINKKQTLTKKDL